MLVINYPLVSNKNLALLPMRGIFTQMFEIKLAMSAQMQKRIKHIILEMPEIFFILSTKGIKARI